MKTVYVTHDDQITVKPYEFVTDIEDITEGDVVVTDTKYGLKIARVKKVEDKESLTATKMVVCRIDIEQFKEKKAQFEGRRSLLTKINEIIKKTPPLKICELLAPEDPTIAELMKELKGEK